MPLISRQFQTIPGASAVLPLQAHPFPVLHRPGCGEDVQTASAFCTGRCRRARRLLTACPDTGLCTTKRNPNIRRTVASAPRQSPLPEAPCMRSKLCLSSILLHRKQGVRPGPACRRQTRQKSETVFRKFVPCGPESFQALSSAGQTNNCPGNRGATPQAAEDAPVLWCQDSQDRQSSA